MNDKFFLRLIWIVSIVVLAVVVALKLIPPPTNRPSFIYLLPHIIGGINAAVSVLLLASLYFIKRKNIKGHKIANLIAFLLSAVFLLFYIVFHLYEKDTIFGDIDHDGVLSATELAAVGGMRMIYRIILFSHIILAIIVLPLVLVSFYRGLKMQVELHRKIVRWSYPVWLYVAVTGVIVYFMISPYYNF